MKRALRWIGGGCTCLSLLGALAVADLWFSSYVRRLSGRRHQVLYHPATHEVFEKETIIDFDSGGILIGVRCTGLQFNIGTLRVPQEGLVIIDWRGWALESSDPKAYPTRGAHPRAKGFDRFGFALLVVDPVTTQWLQIRRAIVPGWFLFALCLLRPAFHLWSHVRRPRFPVGHCQSCGYDLRATPERCPECGVAA